MLQQQLLKGEVLQKTADEMRKQCESLNTEREMLKTQVFQTCSYILKIFDMH